MRSRVSSFVLTGRCHGRLCRQLAALPLAGLAVLTLRGADAPDAIGFIMMALAGVATQHARRGRHSMATA